MAWLLFASDKEEIAYDCCDPLHYDNVFNGLTRRKAQPRLAKRAGYLWKFL